MPPIQSITLDMGRRTESRKVVYLGQGDSNGTTLLVSLTEDSRPYDATGMSATVTMPIYDNGAKVFSGDVNGTTVRFDIDESSLGNVNGRFRGAYVTLYGDFISSSQRFDVDILPSFTEESDVELNLPVVDHTCGCVEGSLTDEDVNEIWGQ